MSAWCAETSCSWTRQSTSSCVGLEIRTAPFFLLPGCMSRCDIGLTLKGCILRGNRDSDLSCSFWTVNCDYYLSRVRWAQVCRGSVTRDGRVRVRRASAVERTVGGWRGTVKVAFYTYIFNSFCFIILSTINVYIV